MCGRGAGAFGWGEKYDRGDAENAEEDLKPGRRKDAGACFAGAAGSRFAVSHADVLSRLRNREATAELSGVAAVASPQASTSSTPPRPTGTSASSCRASSG